MKKSQEQVAHTPDQLGLVIRGFRKKNAMTQAALAQKADLLQLTVSNIESGKNTKIQTLLAICSALDLEVIIRPKQNRSQKIKLSEIFKK